MSRRFRVVIGSVLGLLTLTLPIMASISKNDLIINFMSYLPDWYVGAIWPWTVAIIAVLILLYVILAETSEVQPDTPAVAAQNVASNEVSYSPSAAGFKATYNGHSDSRGSSTYNVTNHGPGVAAGVINVGRQPFKLEERDVEDVISELDKNRPVAVGYKETGGGRDIAQQLLQKLSQRGFEAKIGGIVTREGGSSGFSVSSPITVYPDGIRSGGIIIGVGQQIVFIDASHDRG